MRIGRVMGVVTVSDIVRAEDWYARLFGRPHDREPMASLREWLWQDGGVQVLAMPDRAGTGFLTLIVPDLHAARAMLADRDLTLGPRRDGDVAGIAQIDDPDGNTVTLAERHAAEGA